MRQTLGCGTARVRVLGPKVLHAKMPKLLLEPGEACALRNGHILAFKWKQQTKVCLHDDLSTCSS